MRPKGTAADLEARRPRVAKLLGKGWRADDVAEAVGASRAAVYAWKKAAGKQGARSKTLSAKPQHVPECRLSRPQQTRLRRLLKAGPRKAGFARMRFSHEDWFSLRGEGQGKATLT